MIRKSFCVAMLLALSVGCDDKSGTATTQGAAAPAKLKLQLNWVAEPQFGGFYEAQRLGVFEKHNLDVEIVPGGAGTPTVQMIGAGSVPFGIVSADEIVVARSRGNDVVALLAVYQTCPQGVMTHGSRGFATIADVFKSPGTLAMQRGLPYAEFLVRKYGTADGLRIVPSPGGSISAFLADKNLSQQCFVTSEPVLAKQQGADPKTFLVADAGYNPYTTVLATSGSILRSSPQQCVAMREAVRAGWVSYLMDPAPANDYMRTLNRTMDARTFADSAAAQRPLIETGEIGAMTRERWATLAQQLVDLKVIEKAPRAEECFADLAGPARN